MAHSRGIVCQLAALAALTLSAGSAQAAERMVVPFEINDREHMLVDIEINGGLPTTGVVDTAATFPMVDSRTALRSGIEPPDATARMVMVLGLNGESLFPVVTLDNVKLGNIRLGEMDAAYTREMVVPGMASNVLPVSAFPGDVLEFDFHAGLISAYDGLPERPRRAFFDWLDYSVESGLMFVDVRVNGFKGRALIDTGSNLTYVNSTFADQAHMRTNREKTRYIQGVTGGNESIRVARARSVQLADFEFDSANMYVSDPLLLERLGLQDEPIMVIGLDVLSSFIVQIDRRRNRLVLILPNTRVNGLQFDPRDRKRLYGTFP